MATTVSVVVLPRLIAVEAGCVATADPGGAATLMVKTFDTDPPEKPAFSHALIVTVLLPASVVVPVRVAVAPVDFVRVRPTGRVPLETCQDFGWLGLPVT